MKLKLILLGAFVSITVSAFTQTVTGSWFGTGDVILEGLHNNYLVELNLKQEAGDVQGIIGYYFRDQYQSFYIRGRFDKKTRQLIILNIPLIYFRSNSRTSAECPMDLEATLISSRAQSNLKGKFHSQEAYKYTCPEIAFNYILGDDIITDAIKSKERRSSLTKIWKPNTEDIVVNVNEAAHPASTSNAAPQKNVTNAPEKTAVVTKQEVIPGPVAKQDTAKQKQEPAVAATTSLPAVTQHSTASGQTSPTKDNAVSPTVTAKPDSALVRNETKNTKPLPPPGIPFEKRKDITMKEIEIESDSVRITLYDNGDIDGDIISLYFNKIPLVFNQELNDRGLNLYVTLDSTKETNEVTMFAENLGRIPPNTALMVITDGLNRYEVFMSSSLTQNATVRLKKKK